MTWLNRFKIAIIEKDIEKVSSLLEVLPQFQTLDEMKEAQALLKEAARLLFTLKDETGQAMQQLKKNLEFVKSTQSPRQYGFDIKS